MARTASVSNPDKVLYPVTGFTKAEVVDYYRGVASVLVPHLKGRALTLRRFPDGVEGQSFFEKRCPSHAPDWVPTVEVTRSSGPPYRACTVQDADTLVWLANLAALELHPSLALATDPERPTTMVFDLDPGAPAAIGQCAEVACAIRHLLTDLDLQSVAKTSGLKGIQVYVPFNSDVDFDTTKTLSHTIGLVLQKELRQLVVTSMAKGERPGKVLIDWSQNDRAKTTVSVYSLRAREQPSVSTPLTWDEVEKAVGAEAGSLVFSPQDVLGRVRRLGDVFSTVLERRQQLPDPLRKLMEAQR
ncbi:MAG TPA: non-homologous end-joining DNA ligase [Acidimicrobiales bacterium]|nr:non-homologous end-joining DNA ligase [Acidimicrobiales bacterium]